MEHTVIRNIVVAVACCVAAGCVNAGGVAKENKATDAQEMTPLQEAQAMVGKLYIEAENNKKVETITVTARGFGAPPKQYYPEGNRRLMAMRAAKLDAYRALAERIQGLRIWGGSTVGEMVLEQDRFKVLLDAFVIGANVLSVMPDKDGNYEAIVEAQVDQDFLRKALEHRKEALVVPPESASVPAQGAVIAEESAAQAKASNSDSQANFYFSDH
ncbi:MAG: LPP20 family lipoprotein [Pseudomonadota bacterium]